MKKHYTLFCFVAAMTAGAAFGQTTMYGLVETSDSVQGCSNDLGIYMQTGAGGESGGIISIDWGDGNTEVFNYTAGPNETPFHGFSHGYAVAGSYVAAVNVFSTTGGGNVDAGQTLSWTASDPANCGYVYIGTYQQTPSVNYPGVPYDFTGADGITTTIVQSSGLGFGAYTGLNPANAPYTVSINDAWLAANGLVQAIPDQVINSFFPSGMGNPGQFTMTVTCNVPAAGPDLAIGYSYGWAFIAPLQTGNLTVNLCNQACSDTSDASVSVTFPAGLTPNTSGLTNAAVSGNTLTFDVPDVTDCESITIPFALPGNTPAGTHYYFYIFASNPDDADLSNNFYTAYAMVSNSYDPNDKTVNAREEIDASLQEELLYVIRFQNDGNFQALDVVIRDTISANLDLSTFAVMGSKHGVATSVDPATRIVTFSFNDINLAPSSQDLEASQGYVVYKIWENAGLDIGDIIENTAYIYFDFNPAIVTNTTYNINTALAVNELSEEAVFLYPNPATDAIRFDGADVLSAKVYDLAGKLVIDAPVNGNELSVAGLSNGMYQVLIATTNGIHAQKLVVRK